MKMGSFKTEFSLLRPAVQRLPFCRKKITARWKWIKSTHGHSELMQEPTFCSLTLLHRSVRSCSCSLVTFARVLGHLLNSRVVKKSDKTGIATPIHFKRTNPIVVFHAWLLVEIAQLVARLPANECNATAGGFIFQFAWEKNIVASFDFCLLL